MSRRLLLLFTLACSGCVAKLPPHVWMPIHHVEGVDLFWWTDTQQCQLRIVTHPAPDDYKGFTVENVDPNLCLETLRAEGFSTKGVKLSPRASP